MKKYVFKRGTVPSSFCPKNCDVFCTTNGKWHNLRQRRAFDFWAGSPWMCFFPSFGLAEWAGSANWLCAQQAELWRALDSRHSLSGVVDCTQRLVPYYALESSDKANMTCFVNVIYNACFCWMVDGLAETSAIFQVACSCVRNMSAFTVQAVLKVITEKFYHKGRSLSHRRTGPTTA